MNKDLASQYNIPVEEDDDEDDANVGDDGEETLDKIIPTRQLKTFSAIEREWWKFAFEDNNKN